MATKIPKIIHYCWFGNGEKPKEALKCIESWKKHLPDYQIMEWNEDNFSVQDAPDYVRQAYQAKKYAFVSDYARVQALLNYGGLYFDTDLEVLSRFDEYLQDTGLVLAFEKEGLLMTAFIACEKDHPFIRQFLGIYENRQFVLADGSYDTTPNTEMWSEQAAEWGVDLSKAAHQVVRDDIMVHPVEIFSAFDMENVHEKITENTKTVHRITCSWVSPELQKHLKRIRFWQKVLGYRLYDKLRPIKKSVFARFR